MSFRIRQQFKRTDVAPVVIPPKEPQLDVEFIIDEETGDYKEVPVEKKVAEPVNGVAQRPVRNTNQVFHSMKKGASSSVRSKNSSARTMDESSM